MEPFTTLNSVAIALPDADIDTDIIFPARFLLITQKTGLGAYAFYEHRHAADGAPIAGSPFNDPSLASASILVAGDNFGCGSSREQAAWALNDLGIRCVVSSGFGEIFAANCLANGMLPLVVPDEALAELLMDAQARVPFTVDLESQRLLRPQRAPIAFALPEWRKAALLHGWDEVDGIVARHAPAITSFETRQRAARPWLYAGD